MKLLGWMRTTNRNGLVPSKEYKGVFCCLRAQVSSEVQDLRTNSFSFSRPSHDANQPKTDEELLFDEGNFSGFLTIGTLGRDPETPKFTASVAQDDVTGAPEEMAKIITEKLEKFLEEDSSSKQVERSKEEGNRGSDERPSQGYGPFRSSTDELRKRSNEVKKIKGLLKSLFKRRKAVYRESNPMEKHGTRDLIKRVFKKLHGSPSTTRNDDDDSMHTKKDLRKSTVQIFGSKVHPVLYTPARDDNMIYDRRSCNLKVPSRNGGFLVSSSISEANRKRENWIKTDAEYLVLEL